MTDILPILAFVFGVGILSGMFLRGLIAWACDAWQGRNLRA